MFTHVTAPGIRAARALAALAAAFTLAIMLTHSASADRNSELEARATAAVNHCLSRGGVITNVHYELGENLDIISISIGCWTPSEGFWSCVFDSAPTGPNDGVHCFNYFPNPYPDSPYFPEYPGGGTNAPAPEEPPYGPVPGGGTNAPAPADAPQTGGGIVIVGSGTYAQDGGQPAPTTGQYNGGLVFGDGSQPTSTTTAPVDTVEDEGPTTVEPEESDVITEDEDVRPFEFRRNRGGDDVMS